MHSVSLWSPLMASGLISLKNTGPARVRQLREIGIVDDATLRKLDAITAYRRGADRRATAARHAATPDKNRN
jgi:hypothetical protein